MRGHYPPGARNRETRLNKEIRMNQTTAILAALILGAAPAYAQQKPKADMVVESEPGKARAMVALEVKATVVGIDKATRTVTLKGPQRTVDVTCGDDVKNFDQIRVGDRVLVQYVAAVALELKKTKAPLDVKVDMGAAGSAPGAKPGGVLGRQVTILADVVAVDPKKSTISLKGPRGNVIDVDVRNPEQFKVVHKGDQVQVTYAEAVALSVEPAPAKKPAAKKPAAKKPAKK
jgi:hypothetical protein